MSFVHKSLMPKPVTVTADKLAVDLFGYNQYLETIVGSPPAVDGLPEHLLKDKVLLDRDLAQVTGTGVIKLTQILSDDTDYSCTGGWTNIYSNTMDWGDNYYVVEAELYNDNLDGMVKIRVTVGGTGVKGVILTTLDLNDAAYHQYTPNENAGPTHRVHQRFFKTSSGSAQMLIDLYRGGYGTSHCVKLRLYRVDFGAP